MKHLQLVSANIVNHETIHYIINRKILDLCERTINTDLIRGQFLEGAFKWWSSNTAPIEQHLVQLFDINIFRDEQLF